MAYDATSISNLALAHLGQGQIMSLDDESQAARFCNRFYAQTRDEVIASHRWNFAMAMATPARLAAGVVPFGWRHQYQLPNDCLRVLEMNGFGRCERPELFEIVGRTLLTDEGAPELRYLARVEDGSFYPPLFVDALAMKLAARLAKPLTGSGSDEQTFLAQYEKMAGPMARRMDAVEGRPRVKPAWVTSSLVSARLGGGPGEGCGCGTTVSQEAAQETTSPEQYYVYLAGGVAINTPQTVVFEPYPVPILQSVVTGPPFTASYAELATFADNDTHSSSIEIMVYEGAPYPTGEKVAYGNKLIFGSQEGTSITLTALGCFETVTQVPWNFNCSGL